MALSYSVAEYTAPVWERSSHAHKLDSEFNSACRAITGRLKPINVKELYLLSGIAPPSIRRDVCTRVEKAKQETNEAHSLHGKSKQRDGWNLETASYTLWNLQTSPLKSCHKMQWMAKEDKQDTTSNLCQPRQEPS